MYLFNPACFLSVHEKLNMRIRQARDENWTLTHHLQHPSQETNPLSIVTGQGSHTAVLSNQFRKPNHNPCNLCLQKPQIWLITDSVLNFCPSFRSRTNCKKQNMPHPQPITKDALFLHSLPPASLCLRMDLKASFFHYRVFPLLCLPLSLWLPCWSKLWISSKQAPFLFWFGWSSFISTLERVVQSCLTLCDPMDCSPPSSSVHGTLQARILELVAIPFSKESSRPSDWTCVSCVSCIGGLILYHGITWEAQRMG